MNAWRQRCIVGGGVGQVESDRGRKRRTDGWRGKEGSMEELMDSGREEWMEKEKER
jgi:hypothetical protein